MATQSWGQQMRNNPNFFKEFTLNTNPAKGATYIQIRNNAFMEPQKQQQQQQRIVSHNYHHEENDFSSNMTCEQYNESQSDYSID